MRCILPLRKLEKLYRFKVGSDLLASPVRDESAPMMTGSLLHDLGVVKHKKRQIKRRCWLQSGVHVKGNAQCHAIVARPKR